MSWSLHLPEPVDSVKDIDAEITGQDSEEAKEQFSAAKAAGQSLVDSGALGEGPYRVALSGHANPDHKPQEGWANDTVSISISQA